MNRETKFRAFIPALKIMVYYVDVYADGRIGFDYEKIIKIVEEKGFYFDTDFGNVLESPDYNADGDSADVLCHFLHDDNYIWFEKPDYILMQFAKNENGIDIYEGDVVTCKAADYEPLPIGWSDGTLGPLGESFDNYIYMDDDNDIDIIGNIYENLELIKEDL